MISQLDRIEEKLDRLLAIFDEGVIDNIQPDILITPTETESDKSDSTESEKGGDEDISPRHLKNNHLCVDNTKVVGNKCSNGKTLTIHARDDSEMKNVENLINKYYNKDFSMINMFYVKDKNLIKLDWVDCPEYKICPELLESPSFKFHYNNMDKFDEFIKELNGSKIRQQSIWYPERLPELSSLENKKYNCKNTSTKYPIYVISKGRWEKRTTIEWLIKCDIEFKVVVEPDEYENYIKQMGCNEKYILALPTEYANQGQGSIPARNYAMFHSKQDKFKRCWILDDNINGYMWNNNSQRVPIEGDVVFTFIEDYVDNYKNVLIAGHEYSSNCNYDMKPPVMKNKRVFSSILIDNDLPELIGEGWRGKYNEDVDICIRTMKAGFTTLLFNNISSNKNATGKDKGGNTDGIYKEDNHGSGVLKTQSLIDQHPDCVTSKIAYKPPRTHHVVKWRWDDNELIKRDNPCAITPVKLILTKR